MRRQPVAPRRGGLQLAPIFIAACLLLAGGTLLYHAQSPAVGPSRPVVGGGGFVRVDWRRLALIASSPSNSPRAGSEGDPVDGAAAVSAASALIGASLGSGQASGAPPLLARGPQPGPAPVAAAPAPDFGLELLDSHSLRPADAMHLEPRFKHRRRYPLPLFETSAFPRRYLMLLQGNEGFGAWNDIVWEMLMLARATNRTLVEPCVRNGCLEPCRCGAVRFKDVRRGNLDAWLAREPDPLDVPNIDFPCEPVPSADVRDGIGEAYPLRVYLDMDALRAFYPHIIPYDQWCTTQTAGLPVESTGLARTEDAWRWRAPFAHCLAMITYECGDFVNRILGDFVFDSSPFSRHEYPQHKGPAGSDEPFVLALRDSPNSTVFIHQYYRWYTFKALGANKANVPFNVAHHAATQRFLAGVFGDRPSIVLAWRSEHVEGALLAPCADRLSGIMSLFPAAAASGLRAVLLSDIPAPNNARRMWHTYSDGADALHREAVAIMLRAGLAKYDLTHNDTDLGVLALRDFIMAVSADTYLTCAGHKVNECYNCFRTPSNYAARVIITRNKARKRVDDFVFFITPANVSTLMSPLPSPTSPPTPHPSFGAKY